MNAVQYAIEVMERLQNIIDVKNDALQRIIQWADAYPVDIFPEPDMKKAAAILEANGMSLDSISASNMRHVITLCAEIARTGLMSGEGGKQ